ncbi:MAG TPA: GNAT family N-acetyltransferase [Tepidisphaeraceae bacterium]|jgi:ribosomal protein S18 acetylase RimI-like enzyme
MIAQTVQLSITPEVVPGVALPFVQVLRLTVDAKPVGLLTWHAPLGADGVVQVLDIQIDPLHQRKGYGSQLLRECYKQAITLLLSQSIKPRRLWLAVEQKTQVRTRAFLSRHGFHHIATAGNLLKRQDLMVYSRSFD